MGGAGHVMGTGGESGRGRSCDGCRWNNYTKQHFHMTNKDHRHCRTPAELSSRGHPHRAMCPTTVPRTVQCTTSSIDHQLTNGSGQAQIMHRYEYDRKVKGTYLERLSCRHAPPFFGVSSRDEYIIHRGSNYIHINPAKWRHPTIAGSTVS